MKLSTKGRYTTRALLDIAQFSGGDPVPLKEVAKRQGISVQYLQHLMGALVSAGIVKSVRGAKGGVVLAKPPIEIPIKEVIRVMEGSTAPVECVDNPKACPHADFCATREVWVEVKKATDKVLEDITLQHLVDRQVEIGQGEVMGFFLV